MPAPSTNEGTRALPTADTIKSGSYYRVRGHVILLTSVGNNEWDTSLVSQPVLTSLAMSQDLSFPLKWLVETIDCCYSDVLV